MPHPAPPDDGLRVTAGPPARVTSSNDHETADGLRAGSVQMLAASPAPCGPRRRRIRTVQTIDKGLDRVEGPHAAPQVAIEPSPPRCQPTKRNDHQPAHQSPDQPRAAGPQSSTPERPTRRRRRAARRAREHCVPINDVAEQVRRKRPLNRAAKPPGIRDRNISGLPPRSGLPPATAPCRACSSMPADASTPDGESHVSRLCSQLHCARGRARSTTKIKKANERCRACGLRPRQPLH